MALKRNLLLLYSGEALGKILGMAVFGWLGRVLGEDRYGDVEFAIATIFILNLVMEAGLAPYGAREASKRPEETPRLADRISLVRLGVVGIAAVLLFAFVGIIDRGERAETLVLLYGLILLPGPGILNWVFQARGEMGVVAFSAFLRQVIFAAGVWLVVTGPEDVYRVPLCEAAGVAGFVLLQQVLYRKRVGPLRPWRGREGAGKVARESLPIAASSIAWASRLFFPVIAIRLQASAAATAYFACGHRLIVAVHTFVWLYFFNLLPALSRAADAGDRAVWRDLARRSLGIIAWVAVPCSLLGAVLAPELIPRIYGSDLAPGAEPFSIMVWMLTIAFVSGHHRYSLLAHGRQGDEFKASAAGAIVSVGGCVLLGEDITPLRAAMVFVVAEAVTLTAATALLAFRVERLPTASALVAPALLAGALYATSRALELSPFTAAAAVLAVFVPAIAFFQRDIGAFLRNLRK